MCLRFSNQVNSQEPSLTCTGSILCLTSSFPQFSGDNAGIFVYYLAKDLQKAGWRVDVVAPHAPGAPTHEVLGGVNIVRFRYLWPESAETIVKSGSAVVHLRRNPFDYIKIIPLVFFQGVTTFRKLFAKKYDLIHVHWTIPQGLHGMLASLVLNKPYVVTVHGGDVFSFKGVLWNGIKSMILHRAAAVTVNSSFMELQVKKIAPQQTKLFRIPMGIAFEQPDMGEARQIRQQYKRGEGPLLLFVGRLVKAKGIGDFLKAVHFLGREFPDMRALIVGDGQDREHYMGYADELGVSDMVVFIGHVSPKNVADYYAASDIFIGPSKQADDGAIEGLGMTFIEAMYARIPVVATKSGGIVDSVQHEKTGLLVNESAPAEIVSAVKRLLNEPQLVEHLVEEGYKAAIDKYSRQASAHKFSALFNNCFSRSGDL